MRIDHVIYGTADLDRAAARMRAELGLTAVPGGRREGLGTHNRLVPLTDGTFVELLASPIRRRRRDRRWAPR